MMGTVRLHVSRTGAGQDQRNRSAFRHLLVRLHFVRSGNRQETFRGRVGYQVAAHGRLRTGTTDRRFQSICAARVATNRAAVSREGP